MQAVYQFDPVHSGYKHYTNEDDFYSDWQIGMNWGTICQIFTKPVAYPVWARLEGELQSGVRHLFFSYLYPTRDLIQGV